jgi:N-methylhydantoinase A
LSRMADTFEELERRARAWFEHEAIPPGARALRRTVDVRYAGQNYELPVLVPDGPFGPATLEELRARFARAHEQMYGYVVPEEPMQAVTFRLEASGVVRRAEIRAYPSATTDVQDAVVSQRSVWLAETGRFDACPVYDREKLGPGHVVRGPAIVEQMDATTLLLPGQSAAVDAWLNLIIEV